MLEFLNDLWEFFYFWGRCLWEGFSFTWEVFGHFDLLCGFVGGIVLWHNEHRQQKWEKAEVFMRKYAALVIGVELLIGVICVAPYLQYREEKLRVDGKNDAAKNIIVSPQALAAFVKANNDGVAGVEAGVSTWRTTNQILGTNFLVINSTYLTPIDDMAILIPQKGFYDLEAKFEVSNSNTNNAYQCAIGSYDSKKAELPLGWDGTNYLVENGDIKTSRTVPSKLFGYTFHQNQSAAAKAVYTFNFHLETLAPNTIVIPFLWESYFNIMVTNAFTNISQTLSVERGAFVRIQASAE